MPSKQGARSTLLLHSSNFMAYVSLYRKYRSKNFSELVGQEHITTTLSNAIKKNRIAHAYLFSGPRGTGKTSTARIFAKSLNCVNGPTDTPCNVCDICVGIANDSLFDVIEIDAASNRGIDDIRDLREKVRIPPSQARFKVYIIDEVHMLTSEAFNALLKTLEEPPPYVVFMMATTEPQKLLSTILSRCQRFDFGRLSDEEISGHIRAIAAKEDFSIDDEALSIVVKNADGSMRDSISILDQLISFSGGNITAAEVNQVFGLVERREISQFMKELFDGNVEGAFNLFNSFFEAGKSFSMFIRYLMEYVRDLYLVKQKIKPLKDIYSKPELKEMSARAASLSRRTLVTMLDEMARVEDRIRWETYPRIVLEIMVVRLLDMVSGPGLTPELDSPVSIPQKAADKPRQPEVKKTPAPASVEKPQVRKTKTPDYEDVMEEAPDPDEPDEFRGGAPGVSTKVEDIPEPGEFPPVDDSEPDVPEGADAALREFYVSWKKILEEVKKINIPTYFNIANGKPVSLENGMLVLEFERDHRFHMEMSSEEKNMSVLRKAMKKTIGIDYIIRCRIGEEAKEPEKKAEEKPEVKNEPEVVIERAGIELPEEPVFTPPVAVETKPQPEIIEKEEHEEIVHAGQGSLFDAFNEVFPEGQEID